MKKFKPILITISLLMLFMTSPKRAGAQELSLSVTPPLTEIMVKPGKSITQTYQIINSGSDSLYSVHVYPFVVNGDNGLIDINEKADVANNPTYSDWFKLVKPEVNFGDKFNVVSGSTTTVTLDITIPYQATQKDYYFVVIFQSENETGIGQSVSQTQGRIGSNLLISVTEDGQPAKVADIKEFKALFIVDSLSPINYSLIIKNIGRTFFKPVGKIIINNPLFKRTVNLQVAPQNVLAFSERKLNCLEGENLIDCQIDSPVLLGLYKAKISFTLDGSTKVYEAEADTIAFPFSLILVFIVIVIILKIIIKKTGSSQKQDQKTT